MIVVYRPDEQCRWIVQHYSATYITSEYTYDELERDHMARGFREIGYHYYITYPRPGQPARVVTGRDLSQPGRFEQGAHSRGENDASIGICIEGGLMPGRPSTEGHDTRHPDQIKLLIDLIDSLLTRFGGDGTNLTDGPIVVGHRDMPSAATQCPGYDAADWWARVVEERELDAIVHPEPAEQPQGIVAAFLGLLARIFGGRS